MLGWVNSQPWISVCVVTELVSPPAILHLQYQGQLSIFSQQGVEPALSSSYHQGQLSNSALVKGKVSSPECQSQQGMEPALSYSHLQCHFSHAAQVRGISLALCPLPSWLAYVHPHHQCHLYCAVQVRARASLLCTMASKIPEAIFSTLRLSESTLSILYPSHHTADEGWGQLSSAHTALGH